MSSLDADRAGVNGVPISPTVARAVEVARIALLEERQRENEQLRARIDLLERVRGWVKPGTSR